jgi:hypothetical protein
MPNLTFDFSWYRDSKGYRLVPAKPLRRKPGQSDFDAVMEMPAKDVQAARIVGKGGPLRRCQPLKIEDLFKRFSDIKTQEAVLKFIETYGPLTQQGLRGKGDVVEQVIDEARDMRSRVGKALGKLIVSIDSTGSETERVNDFETVLFGI